MNKQILSFVFLSVVALTGPVTGVIAEPAAATTSTEAADRKFLANLENSDVPKAAPVENAPVRTEITPAPVAKVVTSLPKEKPAQAKVVTKRSTDVARPNYSFRISQPMEVADTKAAPVDPPKKTTTVTTVTQAQPLNDDRDGDHDHDRVENHHFFHRLFAHVFNPQHPDD